MTHLSGGNKININEKINANSCMNNADTSSRLGNYIKTQRRFFPHETTTDGSSFKVALFSNNHYVCLNMINHMSHKLQESSPDRAFSLQLIEKTDRRQTDRKTVSSERGL